MAKPTFHFDALRRALEAQDVEAWLAFYADDAEWIEYRHNAPPAAPNRMAGREAIGAFLGRVKASGVRLRISDEVIGPERAAFCLTVGLASGKRIIEHIIIHFRDGRITRQVDVEAWD